MSGDRRFASRALRAQGRFLVSICDAELLGTTLRGDGVEIRIDQARYGGELIDERYALQLVRSGDIIDLVGRRIVQLALDNGLGHPDGVKLVGDVPFLFIYRL